MESSLHSAISNNCSEPQASSTDPDRDAKFLAMLPRIRRQAAFCLRHLPRKDRAEAIQDVVASSFVSYVRLIERGKADIAYAGPLARYGACQYLSGRRVGNRMNGHDVTSDYCRQKKKVSLERLDRFDDPTDEWQEIVVEDRHSGPAEVATTRVDFRAWLSQLTRRTRQIAKDLAQGYSTSEVACKHGLSASRISQLRRELYDAWCDFTGEAAPATSSALA
jgi:DNA-binding NarL/FixJ family response regulator